ncbi:MAG: LPD38 domain-containing protein, partial [Pseudomonadota bacterium]
TLNTPKGRQIAGGIVMGSLALAYLAKFIGGKDDDDEYYYDKIPNWVKQNNIIFMNPVSPGKYFKIPVPYGFNVFYATGQAIERAIGGEPLEAAGMVAGAFGDAFNPLGVSASLLQTITPSQFRWLVDLNLNKNFFGAPIMKESKYEKLARSRQAMRSTSELSKAIAEGINEATGGGKYLRGQKEIFPGVGVFPGIDISPDAMDYMYRYLTGGAGRTVGQTIDIAQRFGQGKLSEMPVREIPFVRRFVGEVEPYNDTRTFYDNLQALEGIKNQDKYLLEVDKKARQKFRAANEDKIKAYFRMKARAEAVKNYAEQVAVLEGQGKDAEAKQKEVAMFKIIKLSNKEAKQVMD